MIGARKSAASFEIPTATSWRSASQYLPNRGMSVQATATQVADRPDLRPLRAVESHRLASQVAESAIELARCLRDLPTAEAAFVAYEWFRRPRVEMISGAAARTNQAKAGKAAPGQRDAVT